jgi:C4-dicarboxylate transporter, DctM subunit
MLTFALFAALLILLLLDVPIAVAIGLTAVGVFLLEDKASLLVMLPQRMYSGTTGFTLIAIPYFVLAGNLMNSGGITQRIFRFAKALVGHIAGGLGQVSVLSSMIFSGISGSAVADAVGMGQIQYKSMADDGYPKPLSAAIVASANCIGPVIPPSIPFVLYSAVTSVSLSRLFLAGFIPGLLMGLTMMLAIALVARFRRLPSSERASVDELAESTRGALLPLLAPLIIIGGILSGLFTPTEAAVLVTLYSLILGFAYGDLRLAQLPEIIFDSIKQSAGLLFIMAAANFFGWLLIHQRIPDLLIHSAISSGASPASVLSMIVGIVVILGCFLEGNAIFLITLPIFIPIAHLFGIDLINLGVVMTLLIMIGNITPPVGMCLFAVDSYSRTGVWLLARECLPFALGILAVTLLIAFVPQISLFLPDLFLPVK